MGKSVKEAILNQLKGKVREQLALAKESYQSALNHSRSDDIKPEGKYDTRATLAGYLTSAQKQRVDELQKELQLLEGIELRPGQEAALGSLVLLRLNDSEQWHFLSSTSGGSLVNVEGKAVLVISVFSPIGSEVLGLCAGDAFEIETPKETREYLILEIR